MKVNQVYKRGGFTLLEVIISTSILGLLARSLIQLSIGMGAMSDAGGSISLLQHESTKAQDAILDDMRRSGLRLVGGKSYPHIFEAGVPGAGFEAHAYTPGSQDALPGDADFGAQRALVFLAPADMDRDDRPDMDVDRSGIPELDGNRDGVLSEDAPDTAAWDAALYDIDPETGLVWDRTEVSYVVVDGPDGRNYLERRLNGVLQRRVAKDVERLFIETPADTGFQIPTNALRISLFLRRTDPQGKAYRHSTQWVVSLRNGELE